MGPSDVRQQQEWASEIDVVGLFNVIWHRKIVFFGVLLLFVVSGIATAILVPNQYVSEATLVPAQQGKQGGLAAMAGQFAGLANLAGIDLGGVGGESKLIVTLETLKSRAFINHFVEKHELLVPLFAGVGSNNRDGGWLIDEDIYRVSDGSWVRDVSEPFKPMPSEWEIHRRFVEEVLRVTEEKKTGLVKVSIRLKSAVAAKQWLDWIIEDLNEWLREKDKAEKQLNIQYLNEQISKSNVADMQKVFYSIIEKEQTDIMLASVQKEYALKVVNDGFVSPIQSEPNRMLIVVIFSVLGAVSGFLASFILYRRATVKV